MRKFVMFTLLVALAAFAGCGKKAEPATPTDNSGKPEPGVTGDLARFQGNWTVAKLELVPGGTSPEINTVSDADRQRIEVVVTDKLLKLSIPQGDAIYPRYLVLSPISGKSPNELDLIDSDQTGTTAPRSLPTAKDGKPAMMELPRERYATIYKFEGEALILAIPLDYYSPRPTEFKPTLSASGSLKIPVVLVHLKKK